MGGQPREEERGREALEWREQERGHPERAKRRRGLRVLKREPLAGEMLLPFLIPAKGSLLASNCILIMGSG